MKKYLAEAIGTFILVLFGCGTAVVAGEKAGVVGIAFAFGFALIGAAYAIGPLSGCHINPAVSLGVWMAGRMKAADMFGYSDGKFAGAILAGGVLSVIASGVTGGHYLSKLGQNGWGPDTRVSTTDFSHPVRVHRDLPFCSGDPGIHSKGSAGGIWWTGDRHHVGGHSFVWDQHHGCERESGAKPRTGGVRRRQSALPGVDVPACAEPRRYRAGLLFRAHILEMIPEPQPAVDRPDFPES